MRRALALVAAAAMIVGAALLRGWLDDRDSDGGGGGDALPAVLACDPALADACAALAQADDRLEVVVEDAATTRGRLEAADARPDQVGIDGWLTLDPLPTMVAEQRQRAGLQPLLGESAGPVARSPLVLVGWDDRVGVLVDECGSLTWRCVGDRADQRWDEVGGSSAWGRVEPGMDDVARDATGLLVGGQAATSFFDTADFASNDFDTAGFRSWWSNLQDAIPTFPVTRGTVLAQMLAAGPASYDVAGTTEAEAAPSVSSSRESDRLTISYPSPMATADVVLTGILDAPGAGRIDDLGTSEALADALLASGWRVAGRDLPDDADPAIELPDGNGLPRAGVLEALRRI